MQEKNHYAFQICKKNTCIIFSNQPSFIPGFFLLRFPMMPVLSMLWNKYNSPTVTLSELKIKNQMIFHLSWNTKWETLVLLSSFVYLWWKIVDIWTRNLIIQIQPINVIYNTFVRVCVYFIILFSEIVFCAITNSCFSVIPHWRQIIAKLLAAFRNRKGKFKYLQDKNS